MAGIDRTGRAWAGTARIVGNGRSGRRGKNSYEFVQVAPVPSSLCITLAFLLLSRAAACYGPLRPMAPTSGAAGCRRALQSLLLYERVHSQ